MTVPARNWLTSRITRLQVVPSAIQSMPHRPGRIPGADPSQLRRNRSPSPFRVSATDWEDPTLVGNIIGVRVENRSIKTTAAGAIVIEDHFSVVRTAAGSGVSAISENERIGIELG